MKTYFKITPPREMMARNLEELRSLDIRAASVKRDYGEDNPEYTRLSRLVDMIWKKLSAADKKTYTAYMKIDHSAPLPEVPKEGEQERSI